MHRFDTCAYMNIYLYVYVCMYVYMYVGMYVCVYVCMDVCIWVYQHVAVSLAQDDIRQVVFSRM